MTLKIQVVRDLCHPLLVALFSETCFAQSGIASIRGTVVDLQGRFIQRAAVPLDQ